VNVLLRPNKPMPESPAILATVRANLPKTEGGKAVVTIPWKDFVFSTRGGKTFMPPTLQKGLDAIMAGQHRWVFDYASPKGVTLTIRRGEQGEGHFAMNTFTLTAYDEASIRHEALHFVQTVGSHLIAMTHPKSKEWAFRLGGTTDIQSDIAQARAKKIKPLPAFEPAHESDAIVNRLLMRLPASDLDYPAATLIPWNEFVFSTRSDDASQVPSIIQRGLNTLLSSPGRRSDYARPEGVQVEIARSLTGRSTFFPATFRIEAHNESSLRREVRSLVKEVARHLMALNRPERKSYAFQRAGAQFIDTQIAKGVTKPSWLSVYGGPKDKARTHRPAPEAGAEYEQVRTDVSVHALHDIEFHTDALDAAGYFGGIASASPAWMLKATERFTAKMTPERRKAFIETVYARVASEQGKSPVMPRSWYTMFGLKKGEAGVSARPAPEERQEVRPQERPQERPRPRPRPITPVEPRPIGLVGWEIGKDTYGRKAWFIVKGGQRTGKYFYSEEKASAFAAKGK
jgi:hypothetical protein